MSSPIRLPEKKADVRRSRPLITKRSAEADVCLLPPRSHVDVVDHSEPISHWRVGVVAR
jgi:hypothetical protein